MSDLDRAEFMASIPRLIVDSSQPAEQSPPTSLAEWLDYLQTQRDALIMQLRAVERPLVRYGRLKTETLPRRSR